MKWSRKCVYFHFLIVVLILSDLLLGAKAKAPIYVTASGGSTSAKCGSTPSKACAGILKGIDEASSSTQIILLAGTYSGSDNLPVVSYPSGVTFFADQPDNSTVIDCTGLSKQAFKLALSPTDSLFLQGLSFQNCDQGAIEVDGGDSAEIDFCQFSASNSTQPAVKTTNTRNVSFTGTSFFDMQGGVASIKQAKEAIFSSVTARNCSTVGVGESVMRQGRRRSSNSFSSGSPSAPLISIDSPSAEVTVFQSNFSSMASPDVVFYIKESSAVTVNQCTFSSSEADILIQTVGSLSLTNTTFSKNTALSVSVNGTMYATDCVVSQNSSPKSSVYGAGFAVFAASEDQLVFTSNQFDKNACKQTTEGCATTVHLMKGSGCKFEKNKYTRNSVTDALGVLHVAGVDGSVKFIENKYKANSGPSLSTAVSALYLKSLTFQSEQFQANELQPYGAPSSSALYICSAGDSVISLFDCVFEDNLVSGIDNSSSLIAVSTVYVNGSGELYMMDCEMSGNTAPNALQGSAGIFLNHTSATLEGSLFLRNSALSSVGGAVHYCGSSKSTLRVKNSTFEGNAAWLGGGIYTGSCTSEVLSKSSVVISSSHFVNNTALKYGGAGFFHRTTGNATIVDSTFHQNGYNSANVSGSVSSMLAHATPYFGGGALYLACMSQIRSSQFIGNNGPIELPYRGGALYIREDSELTSCVFSNNSGASGGALHSNDAAFVMVFDCIFEFNVAVTGAGIYSADSSLLLIEESNFIANSATWGGGLSAYSVCPPHVSNSVFSTNAAVFGGGCFLQHNYNVTANSTCIVPVRTDAKPQASISTFEQTTIFGNTASKNGGGLFLTSKTDLTLSNSTVSDNVAGIGGALFTESLNTKSPILVFCSVTKNRATQAGSSVFVGSSFTEEKLSYLASNSTFSPSPSGHVYETTKGFASVPSHYKYRLPPPQSVLLNAESFAVKLYLIDSFNNTVAGDYVSARNNSVNVTVQQGTSTSICILSGLTTQEVALNGSVSFQELRLQGAQNAVCNLVFSASPAKVISTVAVVLTGCPPGSQVVTDSQGLDTCRKVPADHPLTLWVMVMFVGVVVLGLLVGSIVYYLRDSRKRLDYTSIPDFTIDDDWSLQSILEDPTIPHIPFAEIEMGEAIGRGACGTVYKGVWNKSSGPVPIAIKQVKVNSAAMMFLDNFLVEIKLLSGLDHPNIVKFYGISCPEEGHELTSRDLEIDLIMELMEQGSLRDLMQRKGKNMPWSAKLQIAVDAAAGIEYLHKCHVIHRDLKAGNLLIDKDWTCKITDFGISTIKPEIERTMTQIGTPLFMAPEVFARRRYTEKADVFSFGMLLYELYAGRLPFSDPPYHTMLPSQIMFAIVNEGIRPEVPEDCPSAYAQLIVDCWNESPELRPGFPEIILRLDRLLRLETK